MGVEVEGWVRGRRGGGIRVGIVVEGWVMGRKGEG